MSLSGYFIILVMNHLMNNEPKATTRTDFEETGMGKHGEEREVRMPIAHGPF